MILSVQVNESIPENKTKQPLYNSKHLPTSYLMSSKHKSSVAQRQNHALRQGCALRKIDGNPVLWNCEIQGTQRMICMKKT